LSSFIYNIQYYEISKEVYENALTNQKLNLDLEFFKMMVLNSVGVNDFEYAIKVVKDAKNIINDTPPFLITPILENSREICDNEMFKKICGWCYQNKIPIPVHYKDYLYTLK
jgi:hypothetical protein